MKTTYINKKQSFKKVYNIDRGEKIAISAFMCIILLGICYPLWLLRMVIFSISIVFITTALKGILVNISRIICKRKLAYLPMTLDEMKEMKIKNLYDYIVFLSNFLMPKFDFFLEPIGPIKIPHNIKNEIINQFNLQTHVNNKKIKVNFSIDNNSGPAYANIIKEDTTGKNFIITIYYGDGIWSLEKDREWLEKINMEELLTSGSVIPIEVLASRALY